MPLAPDPTHPLRGWQVRLAVASLAVLCVVVWCPDAAAQVNRCERIDGTVAYTDHRCSDIGAVERPPPSSRIGRHRIYRGGCTRTLQDLLFEMTTAIDSGDANRLASVYHWAGMSSRNANTVMKRLDAVVHRPLIDIVPVMPRPAPPHFPVVIGPGHRQGTAAVVDTAAERYYPSTVTDASPVGVRVVQTLGNGVTPSDTVFALHRYFGCLWLTH